MTFLVLVSVLVLRGVRRAQVAKHVVKKAPSILLLPLLCCLAVLLSNVISVFTAANDTHTALVIAREHNVQLAEAVNMVYANEERSILEQRSSVERMTQELQSQLIISGKRVRGGLAFGLAQPGAAVG